MSETQSSSSSQSDFARDIGSFCGAIRNAFDRASEAFLPPEEVRKHFRQARVEVWKGIRELVDMRIAHLSREPGKGTRVTVE